MLLQLITSGIVLIVQVNSRVITGATVLKGRAGCSLSRAEGNSGGDTEVVLRFGGQSGEKRRRIEA